MRNIKKTELLHKRTFLHYLSKRNFHNYHNQHIQIRTKLVAP